jgi:hypothetical protein
LRLSKYSKEEQEEIIEIMDKLKLIPNNMVVNYWDLEEIWN